MAALLFILLIVFLILAFPIAIALGLSSVLILALGTAVPATTIAQKVYTNLDSFPLMAIPFFILASNLLATGGVARRLIALAVSLVGHIYGGLAVAGVLASSLFASISGSSPATVVAIGSIMIPAMMKQGYGRYYSVGVMATAGGLGIVIPPSIAMILYGFVTNESVGRLFIAGIVPGVIMAVSLMTVCYVVARRKNYALAEGATWGERGRTFWNAVPSLAIPLIVIGGIYGGIFTPTEAAVVAVLGALLVGFLIHRELSFSDLPGILLRTGKTTAMLFFIITMAMLFAFLLTNLQIPQTLAREVVGRAVQPWMVLLLINIVLFFAGDFMDPAPIILIMAPIFHPLATAVGIDPIHLGIIFVLNMELGMTTPPVGLNLYVASGIAKMPLYEVMKAALPWVLVDAAILLLVTYVPAISLTLPNLVYR